MKYYILFLEFKPLKTFQKNFIIKEIPNHGFSCLYIHETRKIHHIYHNKTKECISNSLYDNGVDIYYFKEIQTIIATLIKNNKNYQQIRRKDFIYIIKQIKQIAQMQVSSATIHLNGLYLILTYQNQEHISVQKKKIFSSQKDKEELIQLFFNSLQNYLLSSNEKSWKKFYHKAQTWCDSHMLYTIIHPLTRLHWTGVSFKTLIALQYALKITNTEQANHQKEQISTFSLYKPLSFQHIKEIPSKITIRKICILFNLSGKKLPHLKSSFQNIQKITLRQKNITCITGTFDTNQISEIFQHQQARKCFDLVIYQGHSSIEHQSVAWCLNDENFILPANFFKYYIHLSCIPLKKNTDIYKTSFHQAILPSTWLPDTDFTNYILAFINQIQINQSFSKTHKIIHKKIGKDHSLQKILPFFQFWQ